MFLSQLVTSLSRYEGELWYEFGVAEARTLLAQFTAHDWRELAGVWKQQPGEWQDRLAYVLGQGNARYEVPQLMRMIAEGEKEVALTARDSFRGIDAEVVKAQFNEECVGEFGLPASLLQPTASVNDVIDYLETLSQYEIRCGEWRIKPDRAS
jgi:hypothetical protein